MDQNGAPSPLNTLAQPTIRSFFQPRTPQYTAPPAPIPSQTSENVAPTSNPRMPPNSPQSQSSNPYITALNAALPQGLIVPIEQHHIQPLRRINSLLLPVNYPDRFYHQILVPAPIYLSRAFLWTDLDAPSQQKVIGGMVCRLDPALAPSSTPQTSQYVPNAFDVYIQSLTLLSPYRGKGLATQGLETIVQTVVAQRTLRIESLYAHVWTKNTEGLEWYAKRGFVKEGGVVNGYYTKLKPDTAWVLRRRLGPSDYLAHTCTVTSSDNGPVSAPDAMEEADERPGNFRHTKSFQDRRPEVEWNDLPEDVLDNGLLKSPSANGSGAVSATSSRSSSRSGLEKKEKKKRQYPAAAFGS